MKSQIRVAEGHPEDDMQVDVPHAGVAQDDDVHPGGRAQALKHPEALAIHLEALVELLVEVPGPSSRSPSK